MAWIKDAPNPGSKEAGERGCTCAVIDNHHGQGFRYGDVDPAFWITGGCPLHDPENEQV